MIAEKYPQLAELNPQDQILLAGELWHRATTPGPDTPELPAEAIAVIEERLESYLKNPESGISWEDLKDKVAQRND